MERFTATGLMLPPAATFYCEDLSGEVGRTVQLAESEAHHIRVLRLAAGVTVGLRNGNGNIAVGELTRVSKSSADVVVTEAAFVDREAPVHLIVPVADRDRMLWLAEKASELNVASWNPVLWHRSKSVSPRGEGEGFAAKVKARMVSAMLQSKSAWIPEIHADGTEDKIDRVLARFDSSPRLVMEKGGVSMLDTSLNLKAGCVLAVGPEGGFESRELERLTDLGFRAVGIGNSILRFETAAIAGISIARSSIV